MKHLESTRASAARQILTAFLAVQTVALNFSPAWAAPAPDAIPYPTGGYTAGEFTQDGAKLTIESTRVNSPIDWDSFNIGSDAHVVFKDAAGNVTINRIGGGQSEIFGKLDANGIIYLLNKSGVLFGSGSRVNVGGLVASTFMDVADNPEGGLIFQGEYGDGTITVQPNATINAGAFAYLVGRNVEVAGTVNAGDTVFAAYGSSESSEFTLATSGGGTITINLGDSWTAGEDGTIEISDEFNTGSVEDAYEEGDVSLGTVESQGVTLYASGAINQGDGSSWKADAPVAMEAAGGDITLGQDANSFADTVKATAANGAVTIKTTDALTLDDVSAGGLLTVGAGSISQAANKAITANGADLTATSGNITLENDANKFTDSVLAKADNGTITIKATDELKLGEVTGGGAVKLDGGSIKVEAPVESTGDILTILSQGKVESTAAGTLTAANDVQVGGEGTLIVNHNAETGVDSYAYIWQPSGATEVKLAGDVSAPSGAVWIGGDSIQLDGNVESGKTMWMEAENGSIEQGTGSAVTAGDEAVLHATGGDVLLGNGGNDFQRAVEASGKNVTLTSANANGLTLGNVTASVGNVDVTATSATIAGNVKATQAAKFSGPATVESAGKLEATSITLNTGTLTSLGTTTAGTIKADTVKVDGGTTTATTSITAGVEVSGNAKVTTPKLVGTLSLSDDNSEAEIDELTGKTTLNEGTLTVWKLGELEQNGGQIVAKNNLLEITGKAKQTGGEMGDENASIEIGDKLTQTGGEIVAAMLTLKGGAEQSGDGDKKIAATSLVLEGDGNDVTLGSAANDFGTVTGKVNNLTLVDASGIEFGALSVGGNLDATAKGGSITQTDDGVTVTGTTALTANGEGAVTLASENNDFQSEVTAMGASVTLKDGTDGIQLGDVTARNGNVDIETLNDGNLTVLSGKAVKSETSDVTLTAAGKAIVEGTVSAAQGEASVTAKNGSATIGGTVTAAKEATVTATGGQATVTSDGTVEATAAAGLAKVESTSDDVDIFGTVQATEEKGKAEVAAKVKATVTGTGKVLADGTEGTASVTGASAEVQKDGQKEGLVSAAKGTASVTATGSTATIGGRVRAAKDATVSATKAATISGTVEATAAEGLAKVESTGDDVEISGTVQATEEKGKAEVEAKGKATVTGTGKVLADGIGGEASVTTKNGPVTIGGQVKAATSATVTATGGQATVTSDGTVEATAVAGLAKVESTSDDVEISGTVQATEEKGKAEVAAKVKATVTGTGKVLADGTEGTASVTGASAEVQKDGQKEGLVSAAKGTASVTATGGTATIGGRVRAAKDATVSATKAATISGTVEATAAEGLAKVESTGDDVEISGTVQATEEKGKAEVAAKVKATVTGTGKVLADGTEGTASVTGASAEVQKDGQKEGLVSAAKGTASVTATGGTATIGGRVRAATDATVSATKAATISGTVEATAAEGLAKVESTGDDVEISGTVQATEEKGKAEVKANETARVTGTGKVLADSAEGTASVTGASAEVQKDGLVSAEMGTASVTANDGTATIGGEVTSAAKTQIHATTGDVTVEATGTVTATGEEGNLFVEAGNDVTVISGATVQAGSNAFLNASQDATIGAAVTAKNGSVWVAAEEGTAKIDAPLTTGPTGEHVTVDGGAGVELNANLEAATDVAVRSLNGTVKLKDGITVIAHEDLVMKAGQDLSLTTATIRGKNVGLEAEKGKLTDENATLHADNAMVLKGNGTVTLKGGIESSSLGMVSAGDITADHVTAKRFAATSTGGSVTVNAESSLDLANLAAIGQGAVTADRANGGTEKVDGTTAAGGLNGIQAARDVTLTANGLTVSGSQIVARNNADVQVGTYTVDRTTADNNLELKAGTVENGSSTLHAGNTLHAEVAGGMTAGSMDANTIIADVGGNLTAGSMTGGTIDLTVNGPAKVTTMTGSDMDLDFGADADITTMDARGSVDMTVTGSALLGTATVGSDFRAINVGGSLAAGTLAAGHDIVLENVGGDFTGTTATAGNAIDATVGGSVDYDTVSAGSSILADINGSLTANTVSSGGTFDAAIGGGLTANTLTTGGAFDATVGNDISVDTMSIGGPLTATAGGDFTTGTLTTGGDLTATAGGDFASGTLTTGGNLDVTAGGAFTAQTMETGGSATIHSGSETTVDSMRTGGTLDLTSGGGASLTEAEIGGDARIDAGGALAFDTMRADNVQVDAGSINMGKLDAGNADLHASGSIRDNGSMVVVRNTLTMTAGGDIGSAGSPINTETGSRIERISGDNIYLVEHASGHNIVLGVIDANGHLSLSAPRIGLPDGKYGFVDGNGNELNLIAGNGFELNLGGRMGTASDPLEARVNGKWTILNGELNGTPMSYIYIVLSDTEYTDTPEFIGMTAIPGLVIVNGRPILGHPDLLRKIYSALAFSVDTPELKSTQGIFGQPLFLHSDMALFRSGETGVDYWNVVPNERLNPNLMANQDEYRHWGITGDLWNPIRMSRSEMYLWRAQPPAKADTKASAPEEEKKEK